jgi:hypothetical protein
MPSLNDFLSRVQTDYEFYLQVRKNPQEALKHYELGTEERAALTGTGGQLWDLLRQIVAIEESRGACTHGDPDGSGKWKIYTTQTWWASIDPDGSAGREFNHESVIELREVRETVDQICAASTHPDRLAAVSALIEHIQ